MPFGRWPVGAGIRGVRAKAIPTFVAGALLAGCTTSTIGPSSQPATVEASPVANPTASAAAEPPSITWSEIPFNGSLAAVIGDRSRFVAVGAGSEGTSAWTSDDGVGWAEHEVPDHSFGDLGGGIQLMAGMGHLVRLGDTLYSIGGTHFNDALFLAGWRWTDGGAWELIESQSEFFNGGAVMAVTASDDALLAVKSGPFEYTTTSWLWKADTSWVETELASSAEEPIQVSDVAWADGLFVAVGYGAEPRDGIDAFQWPRFPSIWTSPDGRDWTAILPPDGMTAICSVTPLSTGGFVVLGSSGERAAAWTSLDGAAWIEGTVEAPGVELPALEAPAAPCQVVPVDGGLLAAVAIEGATLTWLSADGRNWTVGDRLEVSGVRRGSMAAVGNEVVLVGSVLDAGAEGGRRQVVLRGSVEP